MPGERIAQWKKLIGDSSQQDLVAKRIKKFFEQNKEAPGSRSKLNDLLKVIPQKGYFIAGSWATELLTGEKFNHSDIDIITVNNTYLDDATSHEEKCFGTIPFSKGYLKQHSFVINYEGKTVEVTDPITQMWSKLIGELKPFDRDAQNQIKALKKKIQEYNPSEEQIFDQTKDLYHHIVPGSFNRKENIVYFVDAINKKAFLEL